MAETFTCPSCSAPLEYEGGAMQKCRFCGSSVIAPSGLYKLSDLLGGHENADAAPHFELGSFSEMAHQGIKLAEIQRLIQEGKKAEAVKLFHETFGGSTEESTRAVEALARGEAVDLSGIQIIGSTIPGSKPKVIAGGKSPLKGCVVIIAVLTAIIGGAVAFTGGGKDIVKWIGIGSVSKELLKFGGEGNGAGKFEDNRTIAVDLAGNIYSGEYNGGKILMFDSSGNFKNQISIPSTRVLNSLVADRSGNLYALSGGTVFKIDGATGQQKAQFKVDEASAMAIGLDGKIYFGCFNAGIKVYSSDGNPINTISPAKELEIINFDELAVDGNGNVYVGGLGLDGVLKLSPAGVLLARFGPKIKVSSNQKKPASVLEGNAEGIAIDAQGRVYISNFGRISVFDSGGTYLFDFQVPQAMNLAFDDKGNLFVAMRPFVGKYSINPPK